MTVALHVTKQVQKNTFISDVLPYQVWWCDIKQFLSFPKISSANLYTKPIHDIINYSTFICPFESGNCGKEGRKLQNMEYLHNKMSFFDEINSIFNSWEFLGKK